MKTKLLLFGITGDLSTRKLLPALQQVMGADEGREVTVIGVSRRELDVRKLLDDSLSEHDLADRFSGVTMDVGNTDDYARLKREIDLADDEQLLMYLSVPPDAVMPIVRNLGEAGLNGKSVKLLLEKPFGTNLKSGREMLDGMAEYFSEEQVYRIDHYLAKVMAQNIVVMRQGSRLFSQSWNKGLVERIEIVGAEPIGIEGRGEFYEQTGALKDFLQNHLMELLALTLMDAAPDMDSRDMQRLRAEALAAVRPADPARALRAQYDTYRSEAGNDTSTTETFVRLELESTDPQWQGVPIVLTTGKALDAKVSEVRLYYRDGGRLVFGMQRPKGIALEVNVADPRYEARSETAVLDFSYPHDRQPVEAYERVFVAAMRGEKTLFASADEVLRSWEIVQPVLDAWESEAEIAQYASGSSIDDIVEAIGT